MTGKTLVALLALTTAVHASPPAEWMGVPDAAAAYVDDPVFGGRVAVYQAGPSVSSPPAEAVILVHGLGKAAARDWSKVVPALAGRYRVLAIDLPGFGQSDKGNHHYSPDNFARVLDAVVEKRVPGRFTLIGHSMGGSVALAYVAAYPQRVGRLILVDTAGVLHRSVYIESVAQAAMQRAISPDSPWFERLKRAIRSRAENWPLQDEIAIERAGVRQRFLGGDPSAISAFAMTGHDFSRAVRAIAAPTLIIWGTEDMIAPLRTGQALASAIPGARLTVIEGAGHAPMLQFPDRFNPLVLDEIDGQPFAAPPYALQSATVTGNRTARCSRQRDQEFSGDYESLVLDNCPDARISNARVGRLQAAHSTVRIVNSSIRDGIDAKDSRLELTGGTVGGRLTLDATSVDAAATRFESDAIAANSGDVQVVLRLSLAESSRPGYTPRPLHDIFRLAPGKTLIR